MLKKNVHFLWTELHSKVFNEIKEEILKSNILVPFDVNKKIEIQCDASQFGLGCCLLQDNKPISFASRSLTSAEQNYAQIEKEMLSILFACSKFSFYTYGRKVRVVNDHKPLLGIIKKDIHKITSGKLQRMRLKLLNFDIELEYAPGKTIQLADYLSRYMKLSDESVEDKTITDAILSINVSDERKLEMQKETENDDVLKQIKEYCKVGWPTDKRNCPENLRYWFKIRNDITVEDSLLFFNERVIIPIKMRNMILNKLHEPHFGITKTIQRARDSVYWPNINNDIENVVTRCKICQEHAPKNRKEPLIPHEIPNFPFEKVACDILYYRGTDYLVVTDFYSKWIELTKLKEKTATATNNELIKIFAQFGYPHIVIADNMPFGSFQSKEFSKENDIKIINSSPNYPKSNGMAERSVQICKNILKKSKTEHDIYKSLLAYRTTPTKYMQYSPAQLLQNRNLRTNIPMHVNKFNPKACVDVDKQLKRKQTVTKTYYDKQTKHRPPFEINEKIQFLNNNKWERGIIIAICREPRSYIVQSERRYRRNDNHIKKYYENEPSIGSDRNNSHRNKQANRTEIVYQKVTRSGKRY